MSLVHYIKDFVGLAKTSKSLLKDFFDDKSEVLVKIHFGEPGNKTALFPKDVEPIIKALKALGLKTVFIDTPVAYSSERGSVKGYEKVVEQRGWDKLAPFIISDKFVKVKAKDFEAEVCQELAQAKNVLVISHVKGHTCSGFGGAIKNLGMGGVSKKTKIIEHSLCKPKFITECQGCGTCVTLCPAGAIKMVGGKAEFDLESCYGCSICEIECPHHCLAPEEAVFDDLLAQGAVAVAVAKKLPKKTFYINLIKNITKCCDCEIDSGETIADDMGALFSQDPVAIDKASIDLINKKAGKDIFKSANHKDPMRQVNFAAKYLKIRPDYELVCL